MRVLVIGATGYVGSGISAALRAHGHRVVGSARDERARSTLTRRGDEAVSADIAYPGSLTDATHDVDGVIYVVQASGPSPSESFETERLALATLVDALSGSARPLLFCSGAWYYGETGDQPASEDAPPRPPAVVADRPLLERTVLDGSAAGVRSVVVRPGNVYGGGRGLPAMWSASARLGGAARYIGAGENRWAVVHVDDLGDLFVRALDRARAHDVFNAADPTCYRVREMAEAASRGAGGHGRTASWAVGDAREALGTLADALVLDQRVWSAKARERLEWRTRTSTILDDLERGSYAVPPPASYANGLMSRS